MKKLSPVLFFMLSACGTVFSGSDQDISFDSNVKDVKIFVDGMEMCKTPCILPLERKSSSTYVVAKKEGYEDKQLLLRSGFNKIALFNLTYLPSWLTDAVSGGMWQYNRDGVYIDMEKANLQNAELEQSKRNIAIRRFALFAYSELKIEASAQKLNGEYLKALSELSGKTPSELIKTVNLATNEVGLAHSLVK